MKSKFNYWIKLKDGYRPPLQTENETEIHIQLEAENSATAQKMMAKLLEGAPNVKDYSGICVGEVEISQTDSKAPKENRRGHR